MCGFGGHCLYTTYAGTSSVVPLSTAVLVHVHDSCMYMYMYMYMYTCMYMPCVHVGAIDVRRSAGRRVCVVAAHSAGRTTDRPPLPRASP